MTDEQDELEYLRWFRQNADFGPAHSDVIYWMDIQYTRETGKHVPYEWREDITE